MSPLLTRNRYYALINSITQLAAGEWEWIDKAPTIKLSPESKTGSGCVLTTTGLLCHNRLND